MSIINAKLDKKVAKQAEKASDLKVFLDRVKAELDLEKAKVIATEMASSFTAGGADQFRENVAKVTSRNKLLSLVYNASLKGEGMGIKRF